MLSYGISLLTNLIALIFKLLVYLVGLICLIGVDLDSSEFDIINLNEPACRRLLPRPTL